MFSRWGEFAYQHRRVIPLVVVAVIILLYLTFGMRLSDRMSQEGWDDPNSDSTTAAAIEARTFGRDNNGDVILLFTAETGTIDESPEFGHIQEYLTNLLADYPNQIDHITSYFDKRVDRLISQDKRTAFAAIALKGDGDQTLKDFRAIKVQLARAGRMFPGVSTQVAGATAVADALDEGMGRDIRRAEFYALPAVALLLLVVFGSLVAACMPLIVGGLSIVGSLGVLSILAGFAQVNVFAHSVVTLLGLGLAIDYGLFMVSRFREELNRGGGQDVRTAVRRATGTAGKTVVFSAAMVAVALSGLLVFPQAFLKSVAYGAISAVGLAAVLSVTMLPALFSLLGHNIDKFMVRRPRWAGVTGTVAHTLGRGRQSGPARGRGRSRSYSRSRAAVTTPATPAAASKGSKKLSETWWYRLPNWSMQHAVWVTCAIVGGLLVLALPISGVEFGGINETYLPPTNQVRMAQSAFNQEFPEFRTEPIKLVVTNADNDQLVQVYQQAAQVEGLTGRFTPTSATKDGITVLSAGIVDRSHNQSVVDQLRAIEPPPGVKVYVGGTPALEIESIEALFDKLPLMSFYIVLATFVLMALVFGSLVLPAKAVIMTLLGMGATIGLLTWMFVDGVGANLFGFTPGPLMSPVLVLIMAIIYGLSTDYEVFLVSRMVEARERRAATDVAIKFGTAHTGGIISAAAIIMIVVCGAFGFSDIVMMKYIAFGMIFALLFDATIIRMMLVPAVMHLLQDDNWWAPPWVKSAAGALGHRVSRNQGQCQGRGRGQAGRPKQTARPQPQPPQATRPRRLTRSAQQGQPARPVRRPRTNIPEPDSRASVRMERDRASSSKQPSNQHPRREETIELATGNLPPQRFDKPRTTSPSTHRHFSPTTGRNTKQVPFTELLKRLESED